MRILSKGVASPTNRDVDPSYMNAVGRLVRAFVIAAGGATVLSGCTSLASGSDTEQALDPPDPKWACLGQPVQPLPVPDPPPKNVAYALPIYDYRLVPPTAIPGVVIRPCQIQDYDCKTPVGIVLGPTNVPFTIYGNVYQLPVYQVVMPYGVDAFIRINAPNYLQSEYYLGGPLLGSRDNKMVDGVPVVEAWQVTPILATDADNLAKGIHQTRDPDGAIVAMRTLDCQDQPAAGVTLSLSVDGVPFTFLTGQPSFAGAQATDPLGLAGFANIKVDSFTNVTVEGMAPNGMAYGKINVTIRPGQLTHGDIRPDVGVFGF